MCYRLDTTPYRKDYTLVKSLDNAKLTNGTFALTDEQFETIVKYFQRRKNNNFIHGYAASPALSNTVPATMEWNSIQTTKIG